MLGCILYRAVFDLGRRFNRTKIAVSMYEVYKVFGVDFTPPPASLYCLYDTSFCDRMVLLSLSLLGPKILTPRKISQMQP